MFCLRKGLYSTFLVKTLGSIKSQYYYSQQKFYFVVLKVKKAMFLGASAIIIITLNQRVLRKVIIYSNA